MVFFATLFLKQLEQNDKAPKQITSRYLSKQSSVLFNKVLFNKDLPKNSYLFVEPRKKEPLFLSCRILSLIFGDCVKVEALCLGAANPAKRDASVSPLP